MISNSENTTPLFTAPAPDWLKGIDFMTTHATAIMTARTGQEQRTRGKRYPVYKMSFQRTGMSLAEYLTAQTEARAQAQAPLWVPYWPLMATITSDFLSEDGINIDLPRPWEDWWTTGDWIWILKADESEGQWRQITAHSEALELEPIVDAMTIEEGDFAVPGRLSRRIIGDDNLSRHDRVTYSQNFTFETIS
jgi:hypothetical protein